MESRMKVAVLSKKLRARLAVLKKERVKQLAAYDRQFAKWKLDVARWLREVPADRVKDVRKSDVNGRYYGSASLPAKVFEGMPKPPSIPSDEAIQRIQKTLRFVALIGQATISVSPGEVEHWFGKDKDDGDDGE